MARVAGGAGGVSRCGTFLFACGGAWRLMSGGGALRWPGALDRAGGAVLLIGGGAPR